MTIYQYQYLDRVPNWAATDTSIELAKQRGNSGIRRFVTGVLHAILRKRLTDPKQITDANKRLSVSASLPLWLFKSLVNQYGRKSAEAIGQAVNEPAHVSLRVNQRVATVPKVAAEMKKEGIKTHASQVALNALVVESGDAVHSPLLKSGQVTIQDESAMLPVEAMGGKSR